MKTILLCPNPNRDIGMAITERVISILNAMQMRIIVEDDLEHTFSGNINRSPIETAVKQCDMIISLGGDGTILRLATLAAKADKPILGINTGNVGFLAELEKNEISFITEVIEGNYSVDVRSMLSVFVRRRDKELFIGTALNDAVIRSRGEVRTVTLDLWSNGYFFSSIKGDGIIIATPTGSTAYSLSAGGPIVDPSSDIVVVTPICAHSLGVKSFVLPAENVVVVDNRSAESVFLSVDGVTGFQLQAEDLVVTRKSELFCKLIRLKNHSFYDIIKDKLTY